MAWSIFLFTKFTFTEDLDLQKIKNSYLEAIRKAHLEQRKITVKSPGGKLRTNHST